MPYTKPSLRDLYHIITILKTYIAENKNIQCIYKENTVKSLNCSSLSKESYQNWGTYKTTHTFCRSSACIYGWIWNM